MKKVKIISGVLCAVVVLVCLISYLSYERDLHYVFYSSCDYAMIEGYEADILEKIPEGYLLPDYETVDMENVKVVEITYDLTNQVNDTGWFWEYLCYYYGDDDGRIIRLDEDENYWGVRNYGNCDILPPGEHVIYKEYVVVPKDMKQIKARRAGSSEKIVINL